MTPSLFSADGLVGIIFLLMLAATLVGAIVVVTAKRLVRALAGLIVCFVGVASMYFYLNSPFVSMMQILIYVGAIAVTIAFAIMFADPEGKEQKNHGNLLSGPVGFCCATLVTFGLAALALSANWIPFAKINDGSVKEVGTQLLTTHAMVFELVSVLLLIAILGALVIAREGRRN
ncbi:MAG: NADH-quinone oxidoreductase subunit J [Desulfobulbaceae bacterium]|jgi:NADH-quinone oxidoreductase subunit J|nr:NADH-quinone oxidoreductase subunit J [Desulfobulbaceae bacterium]